MTTLAPYQRDILKQALAEEALWILGFGLGALSIIEVLLEKIAEKNTNETGEDVAKKAVIVLNVHPENLPSFSPRKYSYINADFTSAQRKAIYLQGGPIFITSRVLIVDLLKKRLPSHLIAGFVVNQAHYLSETSTEAFILRTYRQTNKTGFIKAFSEHPLELSGGFNTMAKVMRNAFLTKVFLWPRFHKIVQESFALHKPEVIQLYSKMTPAMERIHQNVIGIMNACIKELKKSCSIDISDLTVENNLFKSFHMMIKMQLEPIWHKIGPKARQLVSDLDTLRKLLIHLVRYDCVSFNEYVENMRTKELGEHSNWLFLEEADKVFLDSRTRVYLTQKKTAAEKAEEKEDDDVVQVQEDGDKVLEYKLILEEQPKWQMFKEILDEIDKEISSNTNNSSPGPILVLVREDRTCWQLQDYLTLGGRKMLKESFKKYLLRKRHRMLVQNSGYSFKSRGRGRGRGRGASSRGRGNFFKKHNNAKQTEVVFPSQSINNPSSWQAYMDLADQQSQQVSTQDGVIIAQVDDDSIQGNVVNEFDAFFGLVPEPQIIFQPLADNLNLISLLHQIRPNFVILFDGDVSAIRQLELFKLMTPGANLRIYFATYQNSIEEQKFLSSIKKEQDSFDKLIREKASMVIPENQDGKSEEPENLLEQINSRKGGKLMKEKPRILIDVREFRSKLPSLLHSRGFEVVPMTLEVGDYILAPDVAVERKSISDLFQSFYSGRLYNQMEAMGRAFPNPILLIEFEEHQPFCLQPEREIGQDIEYNNIISKIVLLTQHFPKLRLLWSKSPYETATHFEALKDRRGQPQEALFATNNEEAIEDSAVFDPISVLRRLPGVNEQNIQNIIKNVENLSHLATMDMKDLSNLMGKFNAQQLVDFFKKAKFVNQ
jgi:DNA excision repair protein ERCC-4